MSEIPLFFSIVIATYNRSHDLQRCLDSLTLLQDSPYGFEVIVVDDGSKTPLDEIINTYKNQLNIRLIRQENAGCGAARNTGAKNAQGKFLVFTDDDCSHPPDWLEKLGDRFSQTPDAMIGGKTINKLVNNPFSTASQLLMDYLFSYYNNEPNKAKYFNAIALPTEKFQAMGGFDITFAMAGEDRDFCDRWLGHGYQMIYAPEVIIYHHHHLTLKSFWRQQFNYGRGAYLFHQASAKKTEKQTGMQPASFYTNLLMFSVTEKSTQPAWLVASLFFMSQLAIAFGLLWEKLRQAMNLKESNSVASRQVRS